MLVIIKELWIQEWPEVKIKTEAETSSFSCGSTTKASNQNHINNITSYNNCNDYRYFNKRPYCKQVFNNVYTGTLWFNIISSNIPTLLIKYIWSILYSYENRWWWCDIKASQWTHYSTGTGPTTTCTQTHQPPIASISSKNMIQAFLERAISNNSLTIRAP